MCSIYAIKIKSKKMSKEILKLFTTMLGILSVIIALKSLYTIIIFRNEKSIYKKLNKFECSICNINFGQKQNLRLS
jgi:hypothetical protein